MSKSEIIDKLTSQMGILNGWFIGYIAALIGVVVFVCGFIVFSQKKELKDMKHAVDDKLETIDQKQKEMESSLKTIGQNTVLLAAGRPFMKGITHWQDMLDIYNLAQSNILALDDFHLKHLKSAVIYNYFGQLVDQQIMDDEEQYSFFETKVEDGYDVVIDIHFSKLVDKLQTIENVDTKIAAFNDLSTFKKFWEETK